MKRIAVIPLVILVLAGCQSVSEPEVDAPILPPAFELTVGITAVKLFDAIPAFETGPVTSPASAIVFAEKTLTVTRTVGSSLIISSTADGTGPIVVDNFMTIDGTNVCIGGIESPAGNQNCFAALLGGRTGPIETLLSPVAPLDVTTTIPLGTSTVTFQLRDFGAIGGSTTLFLITATPAINVTIDIKPGSDPNSINCTGENETITVAILTTDDFDATTVDHTTVTFEGASETHVDKKTGALKRHEEDVDGDGDTDLVLHFRLGDTDLDCGSTDGTLTGETFDGQAIEGADVVRMIDAGGGTAAQIISQDTCDGDLCASIRASVVNSPTGGTKLIVTLRNNQGILTAAAQSYISHVHFSGPEFIFGPTNHSAENLLTRVSLIGDASWFGTVPTSPFEIDVRNSAGTTPNTGTFLFEPGQGANVGFRGIVGCDYVLADDPAFGTLATGGIRTCGPNAAVQFEFDFATSFTVDDIHLSRWTVLEANVGVQLAGAGTNVDVPDVITVTNVIPEPSTWLLLGTGLLGLGFVAWRRKEEDEAA